MLKEVKVAASDFGINDLSSRNMTSPLSQRGTKFGIRLLHGKCYLRTKPGYSKTILAIQLATLHWGISWIVPFEF